VEPPNNKLDFDEQFCEGDPTLDSLDLGELNALGKFVDTIQAANPEGSEARNMDNLDLLQAMYGDDLDVL